MTKKLFDNLQKLMMFYTFEYLACFSLFCFNAMYNEIFFYYWNTICTLCFLVTQFRILLITPWSQNIFSQKFTITDVSLQKLGCLVLWGGLRCLQKATSHWRVLSPVVVNAHQLTTPAAHMCPRVEHRVVGTGGAKGAPAPPIFLE